MDLLSPGETLSLITDGAAVIDTRPSVFFVQGFIPRSVHIPLTDGTTEYAELLLTPDQRVILLTDPGAETATAKKLASTGFVTIAGVAEGGYKAWADAGGKTDLIIDISPEEFELDYSFDEFYLIDLRPEDEYEKEHIEYAENIPLSGIGEIIPDLAPDMMYYIYGHSFEDAAVAAALFKRSGFHKLRVVNQGFSALKSFNFPIVKKKKPKPDAGFSAN